jgi:hypothetical protein
MNVRCWNCGKDIPDGAKACKFCEAPVQPEPSAEEMDFAQEMLGQMSPEVVEAFRSEFDRSETAEEFVNRIMVGECPKCGSENTGDCEHDPEIDNVLVGRCFDCGHLWCTECGRRLEQSSPECECWEEDD